VVLGSLFCDVSRPVRRNSFAVGAGLDATRLAQLVVERKPKIEPVRIIFTPRPDSAAEAHAKGIESEVWLDLIFIVSGLGVNRVVGGDTVSTTRERLPPSASGFFEQNETTAL
jgi:hypothetical protein